MTDTLEDHICTVSIEGRTISNLRFADDIDGLAGSEDELANLVKRLDETSAKYGMEINAEKTKVQADETDGNCVTFVLHDEDHTLGNSLRYMIMKNSEVEFCGYSITHPSESKINFRIQTRGGLLAIEPFRRGLTELVDVCQHVLSKFEASIKEYRAQREEEMD
ncbi:DNA-directed RNA polymerases I and III subunit RPAC2-like isoform X2 [Eretmochelys imbricata]